MKTHTTNYQNTFICIADDCPVTEGEIPPVKGENLSVANLQYDMIQAHPYKYTSDDVLFQVFATRQGFSKSEYPAEREKFFSKGQPCLRASPLTKRYGWGVHADEKGKVALFPVGSKEYKQMAANNQLKIVKAMNSKKA